MHGLMFGLKKIGDLVDGTLISAQISFFGTSKRGTYELNVELVAKYFSQTLAHGNTKIEIRWRIRGRRQAEKNEHRTNLSGHEIKKV